MTDADRPELKRPGHTLGTVDNALTLLWLLHERGQLRVSEAAVALKTSRSTAYRLLCTLEHHRFAEQDPQTKVYELGSGLLEVGLSKVASVDLRTVARATVERLADEVGETVHVVTLRGTSVLFLDSVETSRVVRVGSRVGDLMPAHCTASGKAMLAGLTAAQVRDRYPDERLEPMTPHSVLTVGDLEAELTRVRADGFATNFGESEGDVAAVGVAIGGQPARRRAALSVSMPLSRLERGRIGEIVSAAQLAAAEIQENMAHTTPVRSAGAGGSGPAGGSRPAGASGPAGGSRPAGASRPWG